MPDIPLSKKYLHELATLYTEYEEHRINQEELSQRLDELREREVTAHEPLGRLLLLRELEETEKA